MFWPLKYTLVVRSVRSALGLFMGVDLNSTADTARHSRKWCSMKKCL